MINNEIKFNEQKEVFHKFVSSFEKYEGTTFSPSPVIWRALSENFSNEILNVEIGDFQSNPMNDFFGTIFGFGSSITPGRTTEFDSMMWTMWKNINDRDVRISEKLGINSLVKRTHPLKTSENRTLDVSNVSGRRYRSDSDIPINWDYLFSLDTLLFLAEWIPEIVKDEISICELGAGWGRIGYYLTQMNPSIKYHIFDIPTSLTIAYCYLKDSGANVQILEGGSLLSEPGISCSLSGDLSNFNERTFDLFINQASFQEMDFAQVDGYFDIIDRTSRYFYNFQRYQDLDMNHEKYPIRDNWKVLYDDDASFNPIWFEQFIQIQE